MSATRRWILPLALLATCLLLGWWWRRDGWTGPMRPFWRQPMQSVGRIEVRGRGASLVYRREGDAWVQVEPFRQPADTAAVRQLLAAAGDAVPLYRQPLAAAPSTARLEPSDATLVIGAGGVDRSLRIGADHPAGLAWIGDEASAEAGPCAAELRQRVFAALDGGLRDDHLFELAGADSDRIRLQVGSDESTVLELERTPAGWRMRRPWSSRADAAAVAAFLQGLGKLRVQGVVQQDAGDGVLHGLKEPAATLVVRTLDPATGSPREEMVRLGGDAGQGARFARIGDRPPVVQLDVQAVSGVVPPAAAFVDPRACGISADQVQTVRLLDAEGAPQVDLRRVGDTWTLRQGEVAVPVDDRAVRELLRSLCETRATGLSGDPARPEWLVAVVELKGVGGDAPRRVQVWRLPDGRWAMSDGDGPVRVYPASLPLPLAATDHPPKR